MYSLPAETREHILTYLRPSDKVFARCAWAAFAQMIGPTPCTVDSVCAMAAADGNVWAMNLAAAHGAVLPTQLYVGAHDIEILYNLQMNGCPKNESTCIAAARAGCSIEHMDWLVQRCGPISRHVLESAAKHGHVEIVKWLHGKYPHFELYNAAWFAAQYGHLECLKYLHAVKSHVINTDALNIAVKYSRRECVDYMIDLGICPSHHTMTLLARVGYLDMIKLLYRRGWEMSRSILREIIKVDRVEFLDWYGQITVLNTRAAYKAALRYGSAECLDWLLIRYAPGPGMWSRALKARGVVSLQALHDIAYPAADPSLFVDAAPEHIEWLLAHGYRRPIPQLVADGPDTP